MPNIKKVIPILNEAVEYALRYGEVIPQEPYRFCSGMSGSDAASAYATFENKALKHRGLEILLSDLDSNNSWGTYSHGWSYERTRRLTIWLNREVVIQASMSLGGEAGENGMWHSSRRTIEPTEWSISKAEYLREVISQLEGLRKEYTRKSSGGIKK